MKKVLRFAFALIGMLIGIGLCALILNTVHYPGYTYTLQYTTRTPLLIAIYAFAGVLCGVVLYGVYPAFSGWLFRFLEKLKEWRKKTPAADITFGAIGVIVGLLIAFLISLLIEKIKVPVLPDILSAILYIVLAVMGFQFGVANRSEIMHGMKKGANTTRAKILDTSVIIDGRILDICRTGMLEGTIVIPAFVLKELRHISDSSDALKRGRGRRGLDIIKELQELKSNEVIVDSTDYEKIDEVDAKLIQLAEDKNGILVTNDYNLNKVAAVKKVTVWNINDLANALKPIVLTGETMEIDIVKEGKENGQGIGYLEDGTIVIVDGGKSYIGEKKTVTVSSSIQTSAGRMVFAKIG